APRVAGSSASCRPRWHGRTGLRAAAPPRAPDIRGASPDSSFTSTRLEERRTRFMKFGLMYEIQIPEPHYDGIEQERYKQVMAQVELADEVGFQYFWTVEHHFLREFSHCSAPEVLYGALSQRTKRIRIGHAVALLPGQYNHPVRVAERAAVLDIVSDGR